MHYYTNQKNDSILMMWKGSIVMLVTFANILFV